MNQDGMLSSFKKKPPNVMKSTNTSGAMPLATARLGAIDAINRPIDSASAVVK